MTKKTMIRRIQPWAQTRHAVRRPDGLYDGFYGETNVIVGGTLEEAEKAIQAALEADKEANKKRRFYS